MIRLPVSLLLASAVLLAGCVNGVTHATRAILCDDGVVVYFDIDHHGEPGSVLLVRIDLQQEGDCWEPIPIDTGISDLTGDEISLSNRLDAFPHAVNSVDPSAEVVARCSMLGSATGSATSALDYEWNCRRAGRFYIVNLEPLPTALVSGIKAGEICALGVTGDELPIYAALVRIEEDTVSRKAVDLVTSWWFWPAVALGMLLTGFVFHLWPRRRVTASLRRRSPPTAGNRG